MADIFKIKDVQEDWYNPGKSIQEFHKSKALVRVLVGGRGSGKSTAVCVEAICTHCFENPGAKVYLLRKTEVSQDATTIETFSQVFNQLGELYQQGENTLFQRWNDGRIMRIPSRVAVQKFEEFKLGKPTKFDQENWLKNEGNKWCSFLEFKGIPDEAKRDNKLRGYESSMALMIEADLMELGDFQMLLPTLRWKNAYGNFIEDRCMILDTNPPGTKHWIANLEQQEAERVKKGEKSHFQFWHISTYENEQNLPPNYIEQNIILPYANNPPMLERMLYGKYADAFDGQGVFHEFKINLHATDDLPFPRGAYLVRGWDFGSSNAVVWSAYWKRTGMSDSSLNCEFWWDLYEQVLTDSDIEKQCRGVMEITAKEFPFWNDRNHCAGVLDFCDPAGAAKKDTGSSISVMNTYGIYPGYKTKERGLPRTISIVNRLLSTRTKIGEVIYQIDKKNCPIMMAALSGGYAYPRENQPNYGSGLPKKDGFYDHVCIHPETKVLLKRGWIPISNVIANQDLAWTRKGWRLVTDVWETSKNAQIYRAEFSNRSVIMATKDHPVWCENRNVFVPLQLVTLSDTFLECQKKNNKNSMGENMADAEHTSQQQLIQDPGCIEMFGRFIMDLFQRVITSIMWMEILPIIHYQTCNALLPKNITEYQKELIEKKCWCTSKKCGNLQKYGMHLKRVGFGMFSMEKMLWPIVRKSHFNAMNAINIIKQNPEVIQDFVPMHVNQNGVGKVELMILKFRAISVEIFSKIIDMLQLQKPVHLVGMVEVGDGVVWNMTVEGEHEYFAEGILLSNCDAARYSKINCLSLAPMDVDAKKEAVGVLAPKPYKNPDKRFK